jgi:hypothetical protein
MGSGWGTDEQRDIMENKQLSIISIILVPLVLMKKTFKSYQAKINTQRNSRRSLKSRVRFKTYRKKKNKSSLGVQKNEHSATTQKYQHSKYNVAAVPSNFSILSNPEKVIKFIRNLKRHFVAKRPVFIDMQRVKLIDYSSIVVLLSIMIRFKSERIDFDGNFPTDHAANDIFMESGFFKILFKGRIENTDRYEIGGSNSIHTHAWKNVDPNIGPVIMKQVSNSILGHNAVYKGLQRTLIELMQNSFNHAEPSKEGEKHWWLSVNIDKKNNKASFSFVDYGVGIFESLNAKDSSSKWFNWQNLVALFKPENNADILKLILDGKLHKTVTGQDFRGKGLPGIKQAMDRNLISKLFIISNDVFANVSENIYLTLSNNFEGTFVYWEINASTISNSWTL